MITGPRRRFCEGIVRGLNATEAYAAAYPRSSQEAARRSASDLLTIPDITDTIEDLRRKADLRAGSAVMSYEEKRRFLARVVRCCVINEPQESDLWQSVEIRDGMTKLRLPDKLAAIVGDNDLAGQGSEAEANDEISALIRRCTR
jgi:hypothetical protein